MKSCLRRFGQQLDRWMLACEVVELPLRAEQKDFPFETIGGNRALSAEREFRRWIGEPPRGRVGCRLDDDVDVVLRAQTTGNDIELQLTDHTDDGLAASR